MTKIVHRIPNQIRISVILPSRKRVAMLNNTLNSIYSLCDPNNLNFEVLVKLDLDDHESIDYIKNWENKFTNISFIVNSRKDGWLNMADFVENLIRCAHGNWIFGSNDDLVFTTPGWNTTLEKRLTDEFKIYYVNPTNGYRFAFPVFPKKLYEILGHISPHNQLDTYLENLGRSLNINELIDDVCVDHDYNHYDDTTKEKGDVLKINFDTRDYHRGSQQLVNDIDKLRGYLQSTKNKI